MSGAATMQQQVAQPRRIALYMYTASTAGAEPWYMVGEVVFSKHDLHYTPLPDGQERELPRQNFTRVSEVMEIRLQPLSNDEVVQNAVAALDEAEREALEELNKKLSEIRGRKAQLLALTHQPEVAA